MDNEVKKKLLLLGVLFSCLITGVINSTVDFEEVGTAPKLGTLPTEKAEKQQVFKNSKGSKALSGRINVQVGGAVLRPGVYSLPPNASVEEALLMAGGISTDANTEKLNYVRKLKDGTMLYVPFKQSKAVSKTKEKLLDKGKAQLRVNLNTASQKELEALPGIGASTAVKIISRRQLKPFNRVDELMEVRGIGKAKLESLKPYVTL